MEDIIAKVEVLKIQRYEIEVAAHELSTPDRIRSIAEKRWEIMDEGEKKAAMTTDVTQFKQI